jgi:hypothetical protein
MKKIIVLIFIVCSFFANAQSQVPAHKWSKSFGGNNFDNSYSVTTDKNGNVYTTGEFWGTVDFDPGTSVFNLTSGGTSDYDIFISKFDSIGNFMWAKGIGSADFEGGYSIVVDTIKNIYVTGYFRQIVDFDPGAGTYTLQASLPGNSNDNAFILKLDSSGNFVWVKDIGGFNSTVKGISLKLDKQGNIYSTGNFSGNADFDPGAGNFYLTDQGNGDVYILKLDPLGNFVWARTLGGTDNDFSNSVTIDKLGNVYTVGTFAGTADLDPTSSGTFTAMTSGSAGSPDIFISKIDNNGNFVWSKNIGSSNSEYATSVQVDTLGNVYTSGHFIGTVDFNPGAAIYNLASTMGGFDSYVLKLDINGNFIWVKPFTASQSRASVIDGNNNIYITGTDTYGIFISKLNQSGTIEWQGNYSGNGPVFEAQSICLDPVGNVYVTGDFNYQISFDNWVAGSVLVCPSVEDIFICKLYQCNQPNAPINITGASSLSVCVGSTATLSVSSPYAVRWYDSAWSSTSIGTGTVLITPTLSAGSSTFYAEAVSCAPSASRTAITVTANPNCAVVWPGDANSDGIANNLDVLELGLHFMQTGVPRASVSNNWQSYYANSWTGTITNGGNLNHSDCNGDGTIDANDTLAIYNNYSLTHTFKPAQTTTVNPLVRIVPDQTMVTKGNWGTASIYLGNFTTNVVDMNGVAFTVDFDNTLIEPNNIYIEYQNSLIDAGQNLYFRKLDFANGKIFSATTQTVSNNVTGGGKIGTVHYQIVSSLATDQVLTIGISQANQSDASGLITPLTSGTGTIQAVGSSVGIKEKLNSGNVFVSPNPTSGILNITFNTIPQNTKIEVYNSIGALVLTETLSNKNNTINTSQLNNGMYVIKVLENNRITTVQKIVKQ